MDIFTAEDGKVETVPENLDECVLCELCLDAAPDGHASSSRSSTTAPS